MNRRFVLGSALLVLACTTALVLLPAAPDDTAGSSLSRRGNGLKATYLYLEARGWPVARWDRPIGDTPADPLPTPALLVLAAPFSPAMDPGEARALATWTRDGGRTVLLPSGEVPTTGERVLLDAFGLRGIRVHRRAGAWDLGPTRWQEATLTPSEAAPADAPLPPRLSARWGWFPVLPTGSVAPLYADEEGGIRVFEAPFGAGRLLLADNVSLFSNARLEREGNLAFLELALRRTWDGGPVLFDERHRGAPLAGSAAPSAFSTPFLRFVVHVLLLWAAAAWSLTRPFGPRPLPAVSRVSSTARDLASLARLHRLGGHAASAGQRLLDLARRVAARLRDRASPSLPGSNDATPPR